MSKKKKLNAISSRRRQIQIAKRHFLKLYFENLRNHLRTNFSDADADAIIETLRKRIARGNNVPNVFDEGTGPRRPITLNRRHKLARKRTNAKAANISNKILYISNQTAKEKNMVLTNDQIREKSDN